MPPVFLVEGARKGALHAFQPRSRSTRAASGGWVTNIRDTRSL